MKVMLNFIPLKTGGGVQVALDFLKQAERYGKDHEWYIVARKDGPFSEVGPSKNITIVHRVPDNIFSRIFFEYFQCRSVIRKYQPDVIYTQFGPQWPVGNNINIAGCAYSNLFYPEIDFWEAWPLHKRVIKRFIDKLRLRRVLKADYRIFETEDLCERAIAQYGLDRDRTYYVKPAASSLVNLEQEHQRTASRCAHIPYGFKVGLLSGYHPNKNVDFLVRTARLFKDRGITDVIFVLTLPKDDSGTKSLMSLAEELGVSDQIFNLGGIPQQGCVEFYRAIDAAVLPSKLESFSNMIAESWATGTPLLISDLTWSRSLCGNGVIYFDYCSIESLSNQIMNVRNSKEIAHRVAQNGRIMLETYPSSEERFFKYLSIIEAANV